MVRKPPQKPLFVRGWADGNQVGGETARVFSHSKSLDARAASLARLGGLEGVEERKLLKIKLAMG